MNLTETTTLLQRVSDTWSSFVIKSETMVEVWAEALEGITYEQATKALARLTAESTFAPSIADIIWQVNTESMTVNEAIAASQPWAFYKQQTAFVNGSGYEPKRPAGGLPPKVTEILRSVNVMEEGWETRFRFAWKEQAPR